MIINRVWAMPNSETFKIKPIKDLINKYMVEGIWADPFVRNSIFKDKCQFTNDLDSSIQATSNLESLDFLNSIETNTIDGVLFDPPYSPRQISECYKGVGLKVNKTDQKRNDMYATSRFGQFKNGRLNPDINIFFLILIILMELN